jgi:hypothetical protein
MPAGQAWYGHGRERCSYCKQPIGWLCDFRGDDGQPCRRPVCFWHRKTDGSEDRCLEHAPPEVLGRSDRRYHRRFERERVN